MKIVAKALIKDGSGNILLLRRSSTHPHFAGHIDFPGGEVEAGESHTETVSREIQEEVGITIPPTQLTLAYSIRLSDKLTHEVFAADLLNTRPVITLSWEHSSFEWMPLKDFIAMSLPKNVDSYHMTVLKSLKQ